MSSTKKIDNTAEPRHLIQYRNSAVWNRTASTCQSGPRPQCGISIRLESARSKAAVRVTLALSRKSEASFVTSEKSNRRHCHFRNFRKGISLVVPVPSDCMPRRDWNETSAPAISASGYGRCRAAGRDACCESASLSVQAGAFDRAVRTRWGDRHYCAAHRAVVVGAAGSAIRH